MQAAVFILTNYFLETLEARLRAMHMKLSQIAMIPILIQSTLETVSKTVDQFSSTTDERHEERTVLKEICEVQPNIDERKIENQFDCNIEQTNGTETGTSYEFVPDGAHGTDLEDDINNNLSEVVFTPPPSPELDPTDDQTNKSEQQLKVNKQTVLVFKQSNANLNVF